MCANTPENTAVCDCAVALCHVHVLGQHIPDVSMEAFHGIADRRAVAVTPDPQCAPLVPYPDMPLSIMMHHAQGGFLAGLLYLMHTTIIQVVLVEVSTYSSGYVPPHLHTCLTVAFIWMTARQAREKASAMLHAQGTDVVGTKSMGTQASVNIKRTIIWAFTGHSLKI